MIIGSFNNLNMTTEFEIIQKAFPSEVQEELNSLLTRFEIETKHSTIRFEETIVGKEFIQIPSRIYYNPPYSLVDSKFTQIEKEILSCIYSRHHNGFIRQKAIMNTIHSDNYWTTPYIVKIIGEYVIEILNDINNNFGTINKTNLILFIQKNPEFYNRICSRVESYWDCYYRYQFPKKLNNIKVTGKLRYVGFQLLDKIDELISQYENDISVIR